MEAGAGHFDHPRIPPDLTGDMLKKFASNVSNAAQSGQI